MELTQEMLNKIKLAAESMEYGSVVINISPKNIKIDVTKRLILPKPPRP
jgi:hypothetical protein